MDPSSKTYIVHSKKYIDSSRFGVYQYGVIRVDFNHGLKGLLLSYWGIHMADPILTKQSWRIWVNIAY